MGLGNICELGWGAVAGIPVMADRDTYLQNYMSPKRPLTWGRCQSPSVKPLAASFEHGGTDDMVLTNEMQAEVCRRACKGTNRAGK